ncbi:MAG TPA: hypothetical protein PKE64_16965 [Anaerolineae bacterium]|nr:hypothetical protein [Anaerolineae bacterium]
MNGPISNFELAKMMHREYEAEASRFWGQDVTGEEKPARGKVNRLAVALGGVSVIAALLAQQLPF